METLYYILAVAGLFALGYGAIWLKRKYNIKETEVDTVKLMLEVVDFITQQFEFKYDDKVSAVVKYCFEAMLFVEEFEGLEGNYAIKIEVIQEKALDLMEKNGITIDNGTDEIVERVVEYIYARYVLAPQETPQ